MGNLAVTMFANETELFANVRCMQTWEAVETGLQGDINYEDIDATRRANPHGYYRGVEQ